MSTFSRAFWSSVGLLWRNVYLGHLSTTCALMPFCFFSLIFVVKYILFYFCVIKKLAGPRPSFLEITSKSLEFPEWQECLCYHGEPRRVYIMRWLRMEKRRIRKTNGVFRGLELWAVCYWLELLGREGGHCQGFSWSWSCNETPIKFLTPRILNCEFSWLAILCVFFFFTIMRG